MRERERERVKRMREKDRVQHNKQIVEGAVGMVRLAVENIERDGFVRLADDDRVRLVSNLMTVLVSDSETHPVISVDKGAG